MEGGGILPGVSRAVAPTIGTAVGNNEASRDLFAPNSGVVIAVNDEHANSHDMQGASQPGQTSTGLPFDEEAKLVYGVILSLRNMARKLSGRSACFLHKTIHLNSCHAARENELFVNYRTSAYKLHVYETQSGYKFVMLGDPAGDSLRFILRQIYIGPFLEYVVRNPLMTMDSRERGIDNEYFRASIDRLVRGLSVFP